MPQYPPVSSEMHLCWRPSAQALVSASRVIECKVVMQPLPGRRAIGVVLQIDLLVLHAPPQAFHKDVVQCSAAPIHADPDLGLGQSSREGRAGKLRALVGVEDLGLAVRQRLVHSLQAEPRLQRVRQRPGQHVPTVPVQHGHQIQESPPHRHIRDIGTPHVVGPVHHQIPQQIRIHHVCRMRMAGVRPRHHCLQIHAVHQARDALVVNLMAQGAQPIRHPRDAIKRPLQEQFIDHSHQQQVLVTLGDRLIIVRGTGQPHQRTPLDKRERRAFCV